MNAQAALWSAQEVRTQAEQCAGQVDIFEAVLEALASECVCAVPSQGRSVSPCGVHNG